MLPSPVAGVCVHDGLETSVQEEGRRGSQNDQNYGLNNSDGGQIASDANNIHLKCDFPLEECAFLSCLQSLSG